MLFRETFNKIFQRIEQELSHTWLKSILLLFCLIFYIVLYLAHGSLPGKSEIYPEGWWGWADQGSYLRSAQSLSNFIINKETYWYPLGYPLLGSFFIKIMPKHPFFIPNLLLFLGIIVIFWKICRVFLSKIESILVIFLVALLTVKPFKMSLIEPWNTIPVHFIAYAFFWILVFSKPTKAKVLLASFLAGLCYLCKASEILLLAPSLIIGCLFLKKPKDVLLTGFLGIIIISFFVGIVALINFKVFGSFFSQYDKVIFGVGCGNYGFLLKSYMLVFDGHVIFREQNPMIIFRFPWLFLVPPGLWVICKKVGWRSIGLLGGMGASIFLYFSFNDLFPINIFRFHLIHYLYWMIPLLFLAAYLGVRSAWEELPHYLFIFLLVPLLTIFLFVYINEDIIYEKIPLSVSQSRISDNNQELVFKVPENCSSAQVIRFNSIDDPVDTNPTVLLLNGITQKRFKDYYNGNYGNGNIFLLSRPRSIKQVTLIINRPLTTAGLVNADFIQLKWKFGISPQLRRFLKL